MEGYGRNEGDNINNNRYQNPRDRASDKSRIGYDATHVTTMSFQYSLPVADSLSKGFAGVIFSGWQANGIVSCRTCFAFTGTQVGIINSSNTTDLTAHGLLSVIHHRHHHYTRLTYQIASYARLN